MILIGTASYAAVKTVYSRWQNDQRIAIGPDHWSFTLQTTRRDAHTRLKLISGTLRSGQTVLFNDFLITRYRAYRIIPSSVRAPGRPRSPELAESGQDLFREQGQVGDGLLVAQQAALAHHQQVAKAADMVVKGAQLVEHVVGRAGE